MSNGTHGQTTEFGLGARTRNQEQHFDQLNHSNWGFPSYGFPADDLNKYVELHMELEGMTTWIHSLSQRKTNPQ